MAKKKMRIDQLAEVEFENEQDIVQDENQDENYADYLAYLEKQKQENAER